MMASLLTFLKVSILTITIRCCCAVISTDYASINITCNTFCSTWWTYCMVIIKGSIYTFTIRKSASVSSTFCTMCCTISTSCTSDITFFTFCYSVIIKMIIAPTSWNFNSICSTFSTFIGVYITSVTLIVTFFTYSFFIIIIVYAITNRRVNSIYRAFNTLSFLETSITFS